MNIPTTSHSGGPFEADYEAGRKAGGSLLLHVSVDIRLFNPSLDGKADVRKKGTKSQIISFIFGRPTGPPHSQYETF